MSPDKPPRVIPGGSKGSSGSSPAGEAKDAAKDAAKKGAKKGGDVAKKTGKKIAEKIVGILKKWLFKKPARYIKLKGKKYLEVSGEKANIVGENSVPTKKRVPSFKGIRKDAGKNTRGARSGSRSLTRGQSPIPEGDVFKRSGGRSRKPRTPTPPKRGRSGVNSKERREKSRRGDRKERNPKQNGSPPRGNDRASPPGQSSTKNNDDNSSGDAKGRKAKLKELKKLPPEEVARAAATDPEARELVMENPSLVDASSKEEAKQKIAIMDGSSPDKAISMGPYSDLDSISSNYGKSWIAVLGYNEMGDGLADAVNDASGKSGGSDSQGDGGKGRSSGRGRGGRGTSSSGSSSAGAGSSGGNGSGVGAGGGSGIAGNGSGLGSSGSGVGTGTGGLGR
jgi:hypothetical protein